MAMIRHCTKCNQIMHYDDVQRLWICIECDEVVEVVWVTVVEDKDEQV
jgi:acetyl-CoA carboxylase beta subunit